VILVKRRKHYMTSRTRLRPTKGVEMVADSTKRSAAEWLRKTLELELHLRTSCQDRKMAGTS
jgi:hypothetical protein